MTERDKERMHPAEELSTDRHRSNWTKYVVDVYDPIKVGSIDGTDEVAHDRALIRALNSKYRPNKKVKGIPEHTVFVGRLAYTVTEEMLVKEFSRFGTIVHSRLVTDIITGMPRGYGFVEYDTRYAALKAIERMHGTTIEGKRIIVDEEWERRLEGWKPRRLGGGFGGRKQSQQLRFGCKDRPFMRPVSDKRFTSVNDWNRMVRHQQGAPGDENG